MFSTQSDEKGAPIMKTITVCYNNGNYRVHASDCADLPKERGNRASYPEGTSLLDIAKAEFADFIDEDPEYYDDAKVKEDFDSTTKVLPCARGLIA